MARDFYFQPATGLSWSGPLDKALNNIEAIRIAKSGREATDEEQDILSRYTGWGDTAVLNAAIKRGLQAELSEAEWAGVRASTLNAHYTALPVIRAIWHGLTRLGILRLPEITAIDPSAGNGHFKSTTPPEAWSRISWSEVEIDPLTSQVLAMLHPESRVFASPYETARLPANYFNLALSNVPFGAYPVQDDSLPAYLRASIHDYFFAKTMKLLCPGGIMAFITSRYTLDKKENAVRKYLAGQADLLAAVRLPNTAFKANAGTEVVTDILFLRKRLPGEKPGDDLWLGTQQMTVSDPKREWLHRNYDINNYYVAHPENILGTPSASGTMYGGDEYTVLPDERNLEAAIVSALDASLPEDVLAGQPQLVVTSAPTTFEPVDDTLPTIGRKFCAADEQKLVELQEIYTLGQELLKTEVAAGANALITDLRERLNSAYDLFVGGYGCINERQNARMISGTPQGAFLLALEVPITC